MKKLFIVFAAIMAMLPPILSAEETPTQQWIQSCGEIMGDFVIDSEGNSYALSGQGNADLYPPLEMVTCKYDANGTLLWSTSPSFPAGSSGGALTVDTIGNIYAAMESFPAEYGEGFGLVTIKYDKSGKEVWRTKYAPGQFAPYSLNSVIQIGIDTFGNVYVATTWYPCCDTSVYTVMKYDNNGNQIWVKNYASPISSIYRLTLVSMSVSAQGDVFLTGGNVKAYITVKFDTNGNLIWQNIETGRDIWVMPTAMFVDSDGNVYVTGNSYDSVQSDYLTVKYDTTGNRLWIAIYNSGTFFNNDFVKIKLDTHKNVYVTGGLFAAIKYDANGNLLWAVEATSSEILPWVNSYIGWAYGLALDSADNIYMTGQQFTLKRDTNGNLLWVVRAPDVMGSIETDESGGVYIAGSFAKSPSTSIIVKYNQVPTIIPVQIDIKPGTSPNTIKLQDTGNIPVAIFSTSTFDAATIDVASLELNGSGVRIVKGKGLQYSFEDVNADGLLDLLVHFDRGALELTVGDTSATVTGMTLDGRQIQGTDSVQVIE